MCWRGTFSPQVFLVSFTLKLFFLKRFVMSRFWPRYIRCTWCIYCKWSWCGAKDQGPTIDRLCYVLDLNLSPMVYWGMPHMFWVYHHVNMHLQLIKINTTSYSRGNKIERGMIFPRIRMWGKLSTLANERKIPMCLLPFFFTTTFIKKDCWWLRQLIVLGSGVARLSVLTHMHTPP